MSIIFICKQPVYSTVSQVSEVKLDIDVAFISSQ